MRNFARLQHSLLISSLLALGAVPALAGVPSPANSTVPACMVACPMGGLSFDVVLRDLANNPVANSSVVIDLSQCPDVLICPGSGSPADPYIVDLPARTLRMFTDAYGLAHFMLRLGGGCGTSGVRVFASGVLLAQVAFASPDQNGDGMVLYFSPLADTPLFNAKLGTSDPTADFDCDGDVDSEDEQAFGEHNSHSCEGIGNDARRSSWGWLKSHYR